MATSLFRSARPPASSALLPSSSRPSCSSTCWTLGVAVSASRSRQLHSSAQRSDHYRTLEVRRDASKRDIKAQFYRLSKKWHPDVNQHDAGAKTRFQEVSEAWATLGNERARRDYDRRIADGMGGSSSMSPRGPYDASDNTARRARATYAWDYQRKHSGPRSARSASSTYHRHGSFTSSAGDGSGNGGGTAAEKEAFDQLQARNARREKAAAARAAEAGRSAGPAPGTSWEDQTAAHTASPIIRFCQVMGLFFCTFVVGSKLAGRGERKLRNEQLDEWVGREVLVRRRGRDEQRELQL